MPLSSYTLIHRYAVLDSGQITIVKNWVDSARKEIGYRVIKLIIFEPNMKTNAQSTGFFPFTLTG